MQDYGCYCKMFRGLTFLGHSVMCSFSTDPEVCLKQKFGREEDALAWYIAAGSLMMMKEKIYRLQKNSG